jgi:RNA polymerase sigma-70 factor (ECF subfamily)
MAAHAITLACPVKEPRQDQLANLVDRIDRRDQDALAALYDQTSSLVYSLALRILRSPVDAEEVTVDVYSQIWRTARAFDSRRGSVMTWLVTITRTRALDRLRSRVHRSQREEPLTQDVPGVVTCHFEAKHLIQTALKRLSPDQRRVIEMSFFSGMSHSELAESLGLPLGTVKTRLRLGMMKLRGLLQPAI